MESSCCAFSGLKHWDESGFPQEAGFYYFTDLANLHGRSWRWTVRRTLRPL
jgi:hypothetical protein